MSGDEAVDMVGVAVNSEVCIGAGQCEMLEEDTFYVDEDTVIAGVVGSGTLPRDRALRVVETCPSGAISIVELGNADETDETSLAESSAAHVDAAGEGSEEE